MIFNAFITLYGIKRKKRKTNSLPFFSFQPYRDREMSYQTESTPNWAGLIHPCNKLSLIQQDKKKGQKAPLYMVSPQLHTFVY